MGEAYFHYRWPGLKPAKNRCEWLALSSSIAPGNKTGPLRSPLVKFLGNFLGAAASEKRCLELLRGLWPGSEWKAAEQLKLLQV